MMCISPSSAKNAQGAFAQTNQHAQSLAMNLARLRKAKGLTQADLAEMVGVDQSTIQRAEKEHPSAKLETYKKCAEQLGVDLSDLFSDNRTAVEDQLIMGFRQMSEDSRDKVLAILELVGGNTPQQG